MNYVRDVRIVPSYGQGFTFSWGVSGALADPAPWAFVVEESITAPDNWVAISPELSVYSWTSGRKIPNKDAKLSYRIRLRTPKDTYYSDSVGPYGTLTKREYLLVKDVMRREILHAKTLAGSTVQLMLKSVYGARCPTCRDPITGTITNSKCSKCFGTGYYPPYHGPYSTWALFTPNSSKLELHPDGSGTLQPRNFEVRLIGTLPVTTDDMLIDVRSGKRYHINGAQSAAELRRIPIIQTASLSEYATTDAAYRVVIPS